MQTQVLHRREEVGRLLGHRVRIFAVGSGGKIPFPNKRNDVRSPPQHAVSWVLYGKTEKKKAATFPGDALSDGGLGSSSWTPAAGIYERPRSITLGMSFLLHCDAGAVWCHSHTDGTAHFVEEGRRLGCARGSIKEKSQTTIELTPSATPCLSVVLLRKSRSRPSPRQG